MCGRNAGQKFGGTHHVNLLGNALVVLLHDGLCLQPCHAFSTSPHGPYRPGRPTSSERQRQEQICHARAGLTSAGDMRKNTSPAESHSMPWPACLSTPRAATRLSCRLPHATSWSNAFAVRARARDPWGHEPPGMRGSRRVADASRAERGRASSSAAIPAPPTPNLPNDNNTVDSVSGRLRCPSLSHCSTTEPDRSIQV
jgi:hypothetical protein